MDICKAQNQINDLLQDIFNEYNRMNETKIQSKCEIDLEMRTMISTIRSLEEVSVEKDGEIRTLKKTVHEYEIMINDLQAKLVVADEEEEETNKFDMLRMQSKELVLKDREIDRLNGLLNHFKNKTKDKKIDDVLEKIEEKETEEVVINDTEPIQETVTEPIQETVTDDDPEAVTDDVTEDVTEPIQETVTEDVTEPIQETVTEDDTASEEREKVEKVKADTEKTELGKLLIVTSKKVKYFVYENENPQKLYEFNEHKHAQKIVGTRTKNDKGKYKVQLLTP
jgi:hypothetical protein